jgi:hypothetical protein
MPIEPTSSFPPVESIPPPRPSRVRTILSVVGFVLLFGGIVTFLSFADISFMADAAGESP